MRYADMVKQSLVDYPGEIAAVLFTRSCNLRCPFCHNPDLLIKPKILVKPIDIEDVLGFLVQRRGFLDGVVISGGEPTLHDELAQDIRRIKSLGFLVKLDTNGTNPALLQNLIDQNCLDYVAMDIKAPLEFRKYRAACGKLSRAGFFSIRSSVHLLRNTGIKVEFRTTVVPALHTPEDIAEISEYITGAEEYTLQQFNPRVTLEPGYANVVPYSKDEMQSIADRCAAYVKEVRVVNING
ncbi:MAG: anaerobic ribonucleoside-triphosphate reductase activating protein [Syntrophomonadaceae bacterium]|nr:anaerobic ribonucleoside-triphosphate reductase activating protein [Syntrophomonadaceae bacterium]